MTSRVRVVVVQRARPAYNLLIIFIIASTTANLILTFSPALMALTYSILVLYSLHLVTLYNAGSLQLDWSQDQSTGCILCSLTFKPFRAHAQDYFLILMCVRQILQLHVVHPIEPISIG
jgi:hypothetical protein